MLIWKKWKGSFERTATGRGTDSNQHSQPFWGHVVASKGAGPSPIPSQALSVESLSKAIAFCHRPETQSAAEKLAVQMRKENGVSSAVLSFVNRLPLAEMTCDLAPQYPARWRYRHTPRKARTKPLRVSNEVLVLLVRAGKAKPSDFEPLVPTVIFFT